jgi:required for meiotic nuclear division protein 1
MISIVAYQVAEQINIKKLKAAYKAEVHSSTSVDLFYYHKDGTAIYVLSYGVVVFSNMDAIATSKFIDYLKDFSAGTLENPYKEDIIIHPGKELSFSYNDVVLPDISPEVVRIVMLNVAQSAFLDLCADLSQQLLDETSVFTNQLERFGKLKISRKSLLKFIGKALNVKNRIIDNLYIFDVPDMVWESEYMDRVNNGMVKTFDINTRFREIEYTLKIVESNLVIFTELVQQKTSNMLEMIIISLILVELVNVIVSHLVWG